MFKHLLIPLDGSRLAEAALEPAAFLTEKLAASVTLIHVIEKNAPDEIHGERHLTNEEDACHYLEEVSAEAFGPNVKVELHIHTKEVSDVARSITDHAAEYEPDLIVMCAHGQGGLRDLMVGSIAQQVIGMRTTPVLLLRPEEDVKSKEFALRRVMVGLDAVPEHERSLALAGELAEWVGAGLHLVNVVQTVDTLRGDRAAAGKLLPMTAMAMLDMTAESALEYLESRAKPWRGRHVEVTTQVRRGDIPRELTHEAAESGCDLIVMGTHGRAGMGAFWSGSVTAKVIGQTRLPLLLVPAMAET